MTDRELLELAAKAAGIELVWRNFSNVPNLFKGLSSDEIWNPLADDGDALRLAVGLGIRIRPMPGFGDDCVLCSADHKNAWAQEPFASDPYAATRRAIVRAAAEIGRSKE